MFNGNMYISQGQGKVGQLNTTGRMRPLCYNHPYQISGSSVSSYIREDPDQEPCIQTSQLGPDSVTDANQNSKSEYTQI